ncbi:hypothetical protein DMENIID0001_013660 [Sergentomyia squamirostris]
MITKDLPVISEFFRDREIFITGGTGFLGKALIEKILYSCPDVKKIYLLLRSKRGVPVSNRLAQLKTCEIFNRIRQKDENLLEKLIPLEGNSMSLRLGLSNHDLKRLENVSVIIHSAASVRFDDPLPKAILMNTRSARELCLIAENLKNLKVLAHISTTYCNPKYSVIEEKIYPPLADWRQAIKLAENLDPDVLDILAPKYMDFQPNTYTFTKSLAEQIMNEYSRKLPIFIFRPSIVAPSVKEPFLGWVDNFNGPTGLLVAEGTGLIRIACTSPIVRCNYQPLDVVTRSLLVAIWKQGHSPSSDALVYNCACSQVKEIDGKELSQLYYRTFPKVPFDEIVWVPNGRITSSYFIYKIFLLFQVIPGIIVDTVFKVLKKKPIALDVMRKFHFASSSLSYFIFNYWHFINDNFFDLMNDIKPDDMEDFSFDFYESISSVDYVYKSILGTRRYLMNQRDEDLPTAKRNYIRFWYMDLFLSLIFWIGLLYYVITRYDLLNISKSISVLEEFKYVEHF